MTLVRSKEHMLPFEKSRGRTPRWCGQNFIGSVGHHHQYRRHHHHGHHHHHHHHHHRHYRHHHRRHRH